MNYIMRLKERIIDMKNSILSKLHVNKTESDATDYSSALKDYLYKEFIIAGRTVEKTDNGLLIKLKKKYEGYAYLMIDCRVGIVFLHSDDNIVDKYFGKLRGFKGGTKDDAYDCASQSATRLLGRLDKLFINASMEDRIDCRTNVVRILEDKRTFEKTASIEDLRTFNHKNQSDNMYNIYKEIKREDDRYIIAFVSNGELVATATDDRVDTIQMIDMRN